LGSSVLKNGSERTKMFEPRKPKRILWAKSFQKFLQKRGTLGPWESKVGMQGKTEKGVFEE